MTTTRGPEHRDRRPEAVAERLIGIFNDGAHRRPRQHRPQPGLFETLARCRRPRASRSPTPPASTSATCASGSAASSPRASWTTTPPAAPTPVSDHAPFLTGPAPTTSPAMRYVTLMGQVTPKVVEKFRTGGGCRTRTTPASTP